MYIRLWEEGNKMSICPICSREARFPSGYSDAYQVNCTVCGVYFITLEAREEIKENDKVKLSVLMLERKLSGLAPLAIFSEQPTIEVHPNFRIILLSDLLSTFPTSVNERLNRSLLNLSKLSNFPGDAIEILQGDSSIFFIQTSNVREAFFIMTYLANDGLIELKDNKVGFPTSLSLTVKGWNAIAELEKLKNESNQAFIAMWFDQEMNPASEMIKQAIEDTNYKAVRIDQLDHNNKIDDEIIAEIQRSKFIVADFSGHRGGVYFEAGYAMGLGIPVIWTCKADHLADLHFDTRQYSHIVWENEDELYNKLFNRIRATIH